MLHQIHTIKDNPLEGLKTLSINGTNAQRYLYRPKKSFEVIQKTLRQSDCLSCGNCCKRLYSTRVKIFPDEPNKSAVKTHLENKGKRLVVLEEDGLERMNFDQTGCIFLGQNHSCDIYADRPQICGEYPFGLSKSLNIFSLASQCPPLQWLYNLSIRSIFASEIIVPIGQVVSAPQHFARPGEERIFLDSILNLQAEGHRFYITPLLGSALLNVIANYKNNLQPYSELLHSPFTAFDRNIVFLMP